MEIHSIFVLIIVLAVICFMTYAINSRQKKPLPLKRDKQEPRFGSPEIKSTDDETITFEDEIHHNSPTDLVDDPLVQTKPLAAQPAVQPTQNKVSPPEEIICLTLSAKPGKPYCGYELLQSLLMSGLRFGAMNIFHRYEDVNSVGRILFSVASASEPGTFEITKMGAYSGKGLMMFLRLSRNKDSMHALDMMLETAKQLIEDLGGEVLDAERKVLTSEKIEQLRKKITDFEEKQATGDLFEQ